jgi:hypothetical protein
MVASVVAAAVDVMAAEVAEDIQVADVAEAAAAVTMVDPTNRILLV